MLNFIKVRLQLLRNCRKTYTNYQYSMVGIFMHKIRYLSGSFGSHKKEYSDISDTIKRVSGDLGVLKKGRRDSMNIVNIIHIGDEVYRMDELPEEKQREIGRLLNKQALEAIGYKMNEVSVKEEINDRNKKDNDQ